MLTIVRKDIAVVAAFGWLIVWLVAPSYLVPAIAAARTGRVFLWVNVAFAAAAIVSVCLLDARSGADRFIHSLPVRRADVVRARYVTAGALAVIVLGIGAAAGVIRLLASASSGEAWPRWLAPDIGLAYVIVMAIIISIYLPCYFRWGYGAGTVVAAALLAGLAIAGDVAGGMMGAGDIGASMFAGLPRGMIVRMTVLAAERWGLFAVSTGGVVAAALLLTASAALAVRAYEDRQF